MKKLITILLVLGMIGLVSASIITYYFLTHVNGVIHNGLVFTNTGNQNIGTCYTGSFCNSNNLSVNVNGNQNFMISVTIPNGVDEIDLNGLNVINNYNDSNKEYFNISQSNGTYNFYVTYNINKYANDSQAILSDIQGY